MIFLFAYTIYPIFPVIGQFNQVLKFLEIKKKKLLSCCQFVSNSFFISVIFFLLLLRTLGFGRMDLTGTMKTGHLISRMTVTVERTVCIYGESLANLLMVIVPMNFLMSVGNNEQNVIQKKQNKNGVCRRWWHFLVQYLLTSSEGQFVDCCHKV